MEVIVMKIVVEEAGPVVAGLVGSGISPLTSNGLNEAFGFAVGLRAIRFGEVVFDAEVFAGGGEEPGAISRTAIGQDALDFDTVIGVEADRLLESFEHAGDFFIWQEAGEGEARVVVDGDMQGLDAGAWIAKSAIAGGANARAGETAQFLDVEVEKIAGGGAFVAQRGRFWRLQRGKAVEVMAAEDAREGGLGDRQHHHDLSIGAALPAESKDLDFEIARRPARLALRGRRVILEALRKAARFGACEPAADGLFTDAKSGGGGAQRAAELGVSEGHLRSRQRSESGISVHVVRAGGRWAECSSTTSLPNPFRADNVLKHDT